MKNTF
jgi:hypothetical protein